MWQYCLDEQQRISDLGLEEWREEQKLRLVKDDGEE
jgi:hypothetical protein